MSIQIITDSTCDLDPAMIQGMSLVILPLSIIVGDQSYLDGETILLPEVYDMMRQGIVPKTAQIPYERTYNVFRSCLEEGNDVIYISFSSTMSGCFALAQMVAEELRAEFPNRNIAVLDSKGGSGATGLIVLQALKMADSGYAFEVVKAEIEYMADHIEHIFSVDDIEWLAKGGRIPKFVGTIGNILSIRPILFVEKGCIAVQRVIRGKKKAIQAVADKVITMAADFPAQLIAITHADDLPSAKALAELILRGLPNCKTTLCQIGAVLGVHLGLKGIGAFCFNQKPEHYCLI